MVHRDARFIDKKRKNYFEGWYVRIMNNNLHFAVILGISRNEDFPHAFIQINDGIHNTSSYFTYPIEDFIAHKDAFIIRIGDNVLTEKGIFIDVEDDDMKLVLEGRFSDYTPLKNKCIMGPLRFLPKLECYHCVVSTKHTIQGEIHVLQKNTHEEYHDVLHADVYIEKDYGTSMPEKWIWMHGMNDETSFMFSLATIPYLGKTFQGGVGYIKDVSDEHIFASYKMLRIDHVTSTKERVYIRAHDRKYNYTIEAFSPQYTALLAPQKGKMKRIIYEGLHANITFVKTPRALKIGDSTREKRYNFSRCGFEVVQ